MKKLLLIVCLLSLSSYGCRYNQRVQSVPLNVSVVETPSPVQNKFLVKDEGWEIPGLSQSSESSPRYFVEKASTESVKVYITWLEPNKTKGQLPVISEKMLSEEERQKLRIRSSNLVIKDLIKYHVDNRPFCYSVNINPKGIGAVYSLYYYDNDGDGKFESVQTGDWREIPHIPQWIKDKK